MRGALCLLLPVVLAAESSLLRIHMVESGGAYVAGSRSPGLSVEVTDEMGAPVAGAVVNVRLPDEGPGGSFAGGLSSEIVTTAPDGRATTSPIRWNDLEGNVDIRVTAAKERLRAGTVVTRRLSDPPAERHGPVVLRKPQASEGSHHLRWILIGAAAAGAVGASLGLRGGATHGGDQPGAPGTVVAIAPTGPPSVGPHY
jgi:hypothetical protein